MAKYIDKDALVAEIERRNEESWLGHYTKEKGIAFDITDDILSFIDTLEVKEEQEEPVSEDLEKVAEEAAVVAFFVSPQWTKTGERLFKAGALWQKQQDSKLPKVWDRETLDEYAYQVAYDLSNDWMRETATWDDVETAVKLGAKWQEERKENG